MSCEALGPNFRCIDETDGAQVLTALYNLDEHGQLDSSSATGIVSNIVSYGFTVATIQCQQAFFADQQIEIDCENPVIGAAVKNNPNCARCKEIVQAIIDAREMLDADAAQLNPNYVPTSPSQRAVDVVNGDLPSHDDGLCQYACLQCIAQNVRQNLQMTVDANCETYAQSYITAFTTGMSYQAEFELTKHQNALKNAGFDITKKEQITDMSIQIADSIIQMSLNKTLNNLQQDAFAIQSTRIGSGSTSIVLQNVEQSMSLSMFTSLASSTYNETVMKNAINYNVLVKEFEIQTNFNDLIKDLDATVQTMEDLLLSLVGKMLITIVALLATALVIFGALFYFKFISFAPTSTVAVPDTMTDLPSTDHQQHLK
jgi:hypothetical protein